mgnify:CR=1 FL=1
MNTHVMFSAQSPHWATPAAVYEQLHAEFNFTLDPCPLHGDQNSDGLAISWRNHRVFCNPPYGPVILTWLAKSSEADLAVFLLPARTDTRWFHEAVLPKAAEIRFIKGRLKFGGSKNSAPFPSMIVIFKKEPR